MEIELRRAAESDCLGIVKLMRDFAEYEKLGKYCTVDDVKLGSVMFKDGAYVKGIVAFHNAEMIGYGLFYRNFASFRGQKGIYLEDLFIDPNYRGQGLGEAMIKMIAQLAKADGAERMDFQVLDWNASAIRFYERLGAESNTDESHFRFTDGGFDALAS